MVQCILSSLSLLMALLISIDSSAQVDDERPLVAKQLEVGLDGAMIESVVRVNQEQPQMNPVGEDVEAPVILNDDIDGIHLESNEEYFECRDMHKDCGLWESMGECDEFEGNPGYMYHHCPKTCGLCGTSDIDDPLQQTIDSRIGDLAILGWGEIQTIHEQHRVGIDALLEEIKRYMLEEVNVDLKYQPYKTKCQNRHFDCTLWALQGEVSP